MSFYASSGGRLMANITLATPAAAPFRARGLFRARQESAGGAGAPGPENRPPGDRDNGLPSAGSKGSASLTLVRATAQ